MEISHAIGFDFLFLGLAWCLCTFTFTFTFILEGGSASERSRPRFINGNEDLLGFAVM
jgi:hypothetical protein